MKKINEIGYLYVNGLINIDTKIVDDLVDWRWHKIGIDIQHSRTNWFDNTTIEDKIQFVVKQVSHMLENYRAVTIIGSSAGGSLAINAFDRLKDKNVCVVIAHGRLAVGNYANNQKLSLYHSARIGTAHSAKSFYDSVKIAEDEVIPRLTKSDKKRILTMTQLTDMVVPISTMTINGVENHRSIAFGHRLGFVAHLICGRDRIIKFSELVLESMNKNKVSD